MEKTSWRSIDSEVLRIIYVVLILGSVFGGAWFVRDGIAEIVDAKTLVMSQRMDRIENHLFSELRQIRASIQRLAEKR